MIVTEQNSTDAIDADLVEYLVVVVPEPAALAGILAELDQLGRSTAVRVLDVVAVTVDRDGTASVAEVDSIGELDAFSVDRLGGGILLSRHDIDLIALALRPGDHALVVLAEDTWAAHLSTAARDAGGGIRAGERVSRARVEEAVAQGVGEPW